MVKQVSGALDFTVARLPRRPAAYFFVFLAWATTLWFLSAGNPSPKDGLEIPHIDKVYHFLYFFGGGALFSAYMGLRWPQMPSFRLFLTVTLLCSVIGRLDEYHQSFNPERSGNDMGDWLADTLGGAAGAWAVIVMMLPRIESSKAMKPKKASEIEEI